MITDSADGFSGRDSILDGFSGRDNLLIDENSVNRARRNNRVDSSSKKSKGKTTKSYPTVKTRDLGLAYPLKSLFGMANKDNPLSDSQFLPSPIAREYLTSDDKIKRSEKEFRNELRDKYWELYAKNKEISRLEENNKYLDSFHEEKESELENKVNKLSTLLGAGAGGLGGYGLTSLMTKNKLLKALGALGGIGNKLNPVNKKHASVKKIAKLHSKFAEDFDEFILDSKIDSLHDRLGRRIDNKFNENIAINRRNYEDLKYRMNFIGGGGYDKYDRKSHEELKDKVNKLSTLLSVGVGGLGGYGLTSLMTIDKTSQ